MAQTNTWHCKISRPTVLQDDQLVALKQILIIFSLKNHHFGPFYLKNIQKFWLQKIIEIWRKSKNQYLFLSAANWPSCSTFDSGNSIRSALGDLGFVNDKWIYSSVTQFRIFVAKKRMQRLKIWGKKMSNRRLYLFIIHKTCALKMLSGHFTCSNFRIPKTNWSGVSLFGRIIEKYIHM